MSKGWQETVTLEDGKDKETVRQDHPDGSEDLWRHNTVG